MTIAPDTIISRRQGLLEAEIDGELVGLHIDNGMSYGFNPSATRVWALIEQPRTFGEIVDTLTQEFEVGRDECAQDVADMLRDLSKEGLVDIGRQPSTTA